MASKTRRRKDSAGQKIKNPVKRNMDKLHRPATHEDKRRKMLKRRDIDDNEY